MKLSLFRELTILFAMLTMVTLSSAAADAILGEDDPAGPEKDFVRHYSSKSGKRGRFLGKAGKS
jgi:hypothetical protein